MSRIVLSIPFSPATPCWTLLALLLLPLIVGCSHDRDSAPAEQCGGCHVVDLDSQHQLACTTCHHGNGQADDAQAAHQGMFVRPAHPDNYSASCGQCHRREVDALPHALHSTLRKEVNLVRAAFGANDRLTSFLDIPMHEEPQNITELADDMLRRRCLRCHLYSSGDSYGATRRGTGCAACHLEYQDGKLVSHAFLARPTDNQCLSCHYGNRVGADYHGHFDHDFSADFRTPYRATGTSQRPYGVEYHQLAPDIHQQRGLICIDCHSGEELMTGDGSAPGISCADCHDPRHLQRHLPENIEYVGNTYSLLAKADGARHPVPLLRHPAHAANPEVDCQVCHAQWSYNDGTTSLLRADHDNYEPWTLLTVQGSSEVEHLLDNNLNFEKIELEPTLSDTITGEKRPGIWYKGYSIRRWEDMFIGQAADGRLAVMRPELRIVLSWIDADEDVRFDGVASTAARNGLLPYTPHTTGPAGIFYGERLQQFRAATSGTDR
ncbi:MAG: hypothetical protein ACK5PS_04270 [Desulfopila sp.]